MEISQPVLPPMPQHTLWLCHYVVRVEDDSVQYSQGVSHCMTNSQQVSSLGFTAHQPKQVISAVLVNAALAGQKRSRRDEPDYDDDFVVDDNEEEDWRQALKSVTRYDPSKYASQDLFLSAHLKQSLKSPLAVRMCSCTSCSAFT